MRLRRAMPLMICCSIALAMSFAGQRGSAGLSELRTIPEKTDYRETSRYQDVVAFLAAADRASPLVLTTFFGYTSEGRALPLAIVGKVKDATPAAVRASGKLRIYIQANIHGGEVEGKEASLALVREIALGRHVAWLNSMVLLVGPVYNADGNERISLTSRGSQNGPIGGAGSRPNAQGLNLNRDHMKLETPEARSMAALLNAYDPQVMLDLHTTNGSRHAYYLTYEVPNNPAVDAGIAQLARQEWMPAVTRAVRAKYDWDFHFYGNVGRGEERAWTTVEDLPRYSHNYWGLRNRFGILSETYSYASFRDRILAVTRFLEETLNFAASNADRIQQAVDRADTAALVGRQLSLRSKPKRSDAKVEILMGETEEVVHPYTGRVMQRRRNVRKPEMMWEYATFDSIETERVPAAYYLPADLRAAAERLQAHGIRVERLDQPASLRLEEFQIDTTTTDDRAFENHKERTVTGKYTIVDRTLPAGTLRVPMNQPLARLAFYLMEPRSNDGLLLWNFFDDTMKDSKVYPILRTAD